MKTHPRVIIVGRLILRLRGVSDDSDSWATPTPIPHLNLSHLLLSPEQLTLKTIPNSPSFRPSIMEAQ
jgi:hypothetical protein